jgi:hypothetical protein
MRRAHGKGGGAKKVAGVGDAVVGVEADDHAGFFEHGAGAEIRVARLEFSTRGIDDDDGARHAGGGDLVRDLPRVADVMEGDAGN